MTKNLYIGDAHVTPDALGEFDKLMGLIEEICKKEGARPVFLGDQHHTHSMIRVEVLHAWHSWLYRWKKFSDIEEPIMLVGNHDRPGTESPRDMHALIPYTGLAIVVDSPVSIGPVSYMPYYKSPEEFLKDAKTLQGVHNHPTLVCHQTFVGALYTHNYPAPDGVRLDDVPFSRIFSGHIHLPQTMGKLCYVGSPRWLTVADANVDRSLLLVEYDDDGNPISELRFGTMGVCKPIYRYEVFEGEMDVSSVAEALQGTPEARVVLGLHGTPEFCDSQLKAAAEIGVSFEIRVHKKSLRDTAAVKESEGIASSLRKYINSQEWKVDKEELWEEIEKRVPSISPK